MEAAHVPEGTGFATKPAIALKMIERALAAEVPFGWVAADSVYGVGDIEMALRRAGKGYLLGVNANHHFRSWAGKRPLPEQPWRSHKGSIPRLGSAYQRAREPKARGSMTGPIANWPISTLPNMTASDRAFGRAAF